MSKQASTARTLESVNDSLDEVLAASTDRPAPLPRLAAAEFDLTGRQRLVLQHDRNEDVLRFLAANGDVVLAIHVTERGPVLRFGRTLTIEAPEELVLESERVSIRGCESVEVTSGEDLHLTAARDLHASARIHNITAELGNVNVKANDDVKLNGERVLVNC